MIHAALLRKSVRDWLGLWVGTFGLLIGFVVIFMVAVNAMPVDKGMGEFLNLPFIRRLMAVMVGPEFISNLTPTNVATFAFTHPLMWALLIAFTITLASGFFAGEMDRGTMDLLATLPIPRSSIYTTLSLLLLGMGLPLVAAVWLGVAIGRPIAEAPDVRLDQLGRVTCHLYSCYVLITCMSVAVSTFSSRRGPAALAAFVLVFYGFALNLFRAMWPALEPMAWTDFLHYYQPLRTVREEAMQWRDLAVLGGASLAWWAAGWVAFTRRDIPAR